MILDHIYMQVADGVIDGFIHTGNVSTARAVLYILCPHIGFSPRLTPRHNDLRRYAIALHQGAD
jgi:hypothetical protein